MEIWLNMLLITCLLLLIMLLTHLYRGYNNATVIIVTGSIFSPVGSRLIDICSNEKHRLYSGYLSSPGFPDMYPPQQNCSCSLSAPPGHKLQISTAFFLLKSSSPCHDWLQVSYSNLFEDYRYLDLQVQNWIR